MIGIVLAVAGNLVISLGLNVQKYVHNLNDVKPEGERRPFTTNPMWWLGLGGTIAGEVGNFLAFGFAGADIVTPLGAVAVVSNAVIACVFLGELFRIRDALGVLLTCMGTVLIVIKAPASDRDMSVSLFEQYATNPVFLSYIATVGLTGAVLWRMLPRVQARHPAYGLLLCSLLGTITVLCSTALSNFIRVTVNGEQQFTHWLPYALIVVAVPCGVGQVRYLNNTMELFDNTQVRALCACAAPCRARRHALRLRPRRCPPHSAWHPRGAWPRARPPARAGGANLLHPFHAIDDHGQRDALPGL